MDYDTKQKDENEPEQPQNLVNNNISTQLADTVVPTPPPTEPQSPIIQPSNIPPIAVTPVINNTVNSPKIIVLQWLTYAFWGWTILATSILTVIVISFLIISNSDNGFTPYANAAVLVLLPISIICDIFYSKKEPNHKTGAASVVMIIHAVLFALLCIAALIAIVFSLVRLATDSSGLTLIQTALYSAIIIFVLYGLVFLRTILPRTISIFHRLFPIVMAIIIGAISIIGFTGPIAKAQLTRNDRIIDDNLTYLKSDIDKYVELHDKLPSSLNSVSLSSNAKRLVDDKLVKYVPNSKSSVSTPDLYDSVNDPVTYYYQLCVNYQEATDTNYYSSTSSLDDDSYDSYLSTSYHPAGNYCYKITSETGQLLK